MKEDDDMDESSSSDAEDARLAQSSGSIQSIASTGSAQPVWRWRRKFRWDMEHLEHGLLRKLSLALAVYGMVVMAVCLLLNIFFNPSH
jgi:hypothetical protein